MRTLVAMIMLMGAAGHARCADKPLTLPPGTPAEQVKALDKQHAAELAAVRKALEEADDPDAIMEKLAPPDSDAYAALMMQIANGYPNDPVSVDALIWIVRNTRSPEPGKSNHWSEARSRLVRDHLLDPRIGTFCLALRNEQRDTAANDQLRTVLSNNPSKEAKGRAAYALACRIRERANWANAVQHANEARIAQETKWFGADHVKELKAVDVAALNREADELLERIVADPAISAIVIPAEGLSLKLGDLAAQALFQVRELKPGKPAPDIIGEDIDGKPMKLSEFRGKAVMLVFCGYWCGPCRGLLPHEREMVEKYKDRPFAIVGVNSDANRDRVKKLNEKEKATWRAFWDGGSPMGPIQRQWNVEGWPTAYLIDHNGIIISETLPVPESDASVEKAVQFAEAKEKK